VPAASRLPSSARLLLGASLVTAVLLAGCGGDGRTLRAPSADQTTTTAVPAVSDGSEAQPGAQAGAGGFTVRLDGVLPGAPLPASLTCEGGNDAPVLFWQNVPAEAAELAVSVTDPDAGGFVHWLVVGIDPSLAGMDGNDLPPGADALLNDAGEATWFGPCPPPGPAHDYVFTLYALAEASTFDPLASATEVIGEMAGASLSVSTVTGTFAVTEDG
jgi:Raf kinase inhibitor-like YbhB/YbcL family protein